MFDELWEWVDDEAKKQCRSTNNWLEVTLQGLRLKKKIEKS